LSQDDENTTIITHFYLNSDADAAIT